MIALKLFMEKYNISKLMKVYTGNGSEVTNIAIIKFVSNLFEKLVHVLPYNPTAQVLLRELIKLLILLLKKEYMVLA